MRQMMDLESVLKRLFSDILSVAPEAIEPTSSPKTIETWDSLQHVVLVAAIEEEFGVDIEPETAAGFRTFQEVLDHLRSLTD